MWVNEIATVGLRKQKQNKMEFTATLEFNEIEVVQRIYVKHQRWRVFV